MPAFLNKLFNLSNRSNTVLPTSANFSYPSNPPLPISTPIVPVSVSGARDSLPPYPCNELPSMGSWPRNGRNRDSNDIDNPFSDAHRASMTSTIRRSKSYAFLPQSNNLKSGSLSRDERNASEENEFYSSQVPLRKRAISTQRHDPSQFLLTRPLKYSQPALSSVQTKEPYSHCYDGINSPPGEQRRQDKGKGKAVEASTQTRSRLAKQCANDFENSHENYYYAASEEGESIRGSQKRNAAISREKVSQPVTPSQRDSIFKPPLWHEAANSVIRPPDVEELNRNFPPIPVHSDEEIARALQFYEQYGRYCNNGGAIGPKTTGPFNDASPVPFPDKTAIPEKYSEPLSPVSSTSTFVHPIQGELRKSVSSASSSVSRTSSRSTTSARETQPAAPATLASPALHPALRRKPSVASFSSTSTVKYVKRERSKATSAAASSVPLSDPIGAPSHSKSAKRVTSQSTISSTTTGVASSESSVSRTSSSKSSRRHNAAISDGKSSVSGKTESDASSYTSISSSTTVSTATPQPPQAALPLSDSVPATNTTPSQAPETTRPAVAPTRTIGFWIDPPPISYDDCGREIPAITIHVFPGTTNPVPVPVLDTPAPPPIDISASTTCKVDTPIPGAFSTSSSSSSSKSTSRSSKTVTSVKHHSSSERTPLLKSEGLAGGEAGVGSSTGKKTKATRATAQPESKSTNSKASRHTPFVIWPLEGCTIHRIREYKTEYHVISKDQHGKKFLQEIVEKTPKTQSYMELYRSKRLVKMY